MVPHGSDRVRVAGEKIILFSPISKGWQPRVPRTNLRSEHPGTAVLWDEQYYEVLDADLMQGGGVRYVLAAWQDEHVFRFFDAYDDESEARRIADYNATLKQRRHSKAVSLLGVIFGHLPAPVQNRLGNEYGVAAHRMTLISIVPSMVLLGICVWFYVDARLKQTASIIPTWLWLFAMLMLADSGVRFLVVMLQSRAQGSLPGTLVYFILWKLAPARFPSPVEERGRGVFMLAPEEDVALRDAIQMRAPLFTLLTPAEQRRLAERFGFEYRRHAFAPAIVILVCAILGAVSSFVKVADSGSVSALLSLIIAGGLSIEQVVRLLALQRGPAGSVLGALVRPFVRGFLG